jgi:hypothetical protein
LCHRFYVKEILMANEHNSIHRSSPSIGEDNHTLDGDSDLDKTKKRAKRERDAATRRDTLIKEMQMFTNAATMVPAN